MWRLTMFVSLALAAPGTEYGDETLKKIQVVFRHGIRYPANLFWMDECSHAYTKEDLGNLTDSGKNQMRRLGEYLRTRYDTFIGSNSSVVKVIYSDFHRDLESAIYVSEGLFRNFLTPAVELEKLSKEDEGPMVSSQQHLMTEINSRPWSDDEEQLCAVLDDIDGVTCKTKVHFFGIGDQMISEETEGCSLPSWFNAKFRKQLRNFLSKAFQSSRLCSKEQMVHDHSDAFLKNITNIFSPEGAEMGKKVYLYALHDMNVDFLMIRMGIPYLGRPDFGAALIFEEHKIVDKWVVRVFYDSSEDYTFRTRLNVKGCEMDCPYEDFTRITTGAYQCYDTLPSGAADNSAGSFAASRSFGLMVTCALVIRALRLQ